MKRKQQKVYIVTDTEYEYDGFHELAHATMPLAYFLVWNARQDEKRDFLHKQDLVVVYKKVFGWKLRLQAHVPFKTIIKTPRIYCVQRMSDYRYFLIAPKGLKYMLNFH